MPITEPVVAGRLGSPDWPDLGHVLASGSEAQGIQITRIESRGKMVPGRRRRVILLEERKIDCGQLKVTMSALYLTVRVCVRVRGCNYTNYSSNKDSYHQLFTVYQHYSNHFTSISSFNPYTNPVIIFNGQEFRSKRINYHATLSHIKKTVVRSILEYLRFFFPSHHPTGGVDSLSRR